MKTATRIFFVTAAALMVATLPVLAQPASVNASLSVSAVVSARAKLTLSIGAISFPDADPDLTPTINASEGPVTVDTKTKTGTSGAVTLTVVAGADLTSGSDTIPAANLRWTAGGAGFTTPGAMSTTAQTLASWTGSGTRSGVQSYSLNNSWAYATGNYTMTITYTLTAP
ncbi:MAG TPA: hypothetical protein VK886_22725 [Vicinamibacterales bacterium]|nr:hypothetical protein [Vicinamibacterales bacterium]